MKVGGSADINHNPTKPKSVPAELSCPIPYWRRILNPWLFEVTLWWMNEKKCASRTFICKVKTWSLYLKSFGQILVLVPRRLSGSRLKWDFQIERHISQMQVFLWSLYLTDARPLSAHLQWSKREKQTKTNCAKGEKGKGNVFLTQSIEKEVGELRSLEKFTTLITHPANPIFL